MLQVGLRSACLFPITAVSHSAFGSCVYHVCVFQVYVLDRLG